MFRSGTTTLIILNEELKNIMKIVKSPEEFGLLIKGVSKAIKNETIVQKGGFIGMLSGTVCASLSENVLTGKSTIRASQDF